MRTNPVTRPRFRSENVASGGLVDIIRGIFGMGSPAPGIASQKVKQTPAHLGGLYHYHEGDVFLPGTGNYALDPSLETPLATVWGHGFLSGVNAFSAYQPPQVFAQPRVLPVGIGGIVAGQFITQPLSEPGQ